MEHASSSTSLQSLEHFPEQILMSDYWQDFLKTNWGIPDRDADVQFVPDPTILHELEDPIISPINWLGVARVSGTDAKAFLQAQFTGDIEAILPGTSSLSGYCDPKGRLLAIFRVVPIADDFLLLTDYQVLPTVVDRLKMYILRMKVEIAIEESYVVVGISGPNSPAIVMKLTAARESLNVNSKEAANTNFVIASSDYISGYLVVAKPKETVDVWTSIRDGVTLVSSAVWSLLEIRSGVARITPNTQQKCIPQSVNLDLVGGVSFSKGCYPGQEIVARVRYLGRLKQRLARATSTPGTIPTSGDPVFFGHDKDRRVGMVINSVGFPDKTGEVLAVVPTSCTVGSRLVLHLDGSQQLRLVEVASKVKGE